MKTKRLSLVILSALMTLALSLFAACTPTPDGSYKPGDEVGSYYCITDGKEATLTIASDGIVSLSLNDESLSGAASKDASNPNKLTISFGDAEELTAEAIYNSNAITLSFKGLEYRFLRDVMYTVTFDSMGGSAVEAKQVRNGNTVSRPNDPVKLDADGNQMVFVGWYKDEAGNEPYQFGAEVVSGDITLYAVYGESLANEFTVTLNPNYEGAEVTTMHTSDGVAENLPTPTRGADYKFVGWYVSDYDDPAKLTYQYQGQVLKQNTTLYAVWAALTNQTPVVSVSANQVTWTNVGLGTCNVTIMNAANDLVANAAVEGTSYDFDFSALAAGEYTVRVSYRGEVGEAYYKNKALPKVSLFSVLNGTALSFNAVEGAEEYLITIDCGNKNHKHTAMSNGLSTSYNFANCDMQKGGIKFTVTALAQGYISSVSDVFVFEQGLAAVENLVVNEEGYLTWDVVENATTYRVVVTADGVTTTHYLSENKLSVKEYGEGVINFEVTPIADTYYSPDAATYGYVKTTLAAPSNIKLSETTLVWDAQEGVSYYNVKIGETVLRSISNSLVLEESYFVGTDWTVAVQAVSNTASSLYSDSVSISNQAQLTPDLVSYSNGVVTWGNVFGAQRYRVQVGDAAAQLVGADVHSQEIAFDAPGEYTVQISAYGANIASTAVTIEITVYEVYFVSNGGTDVEAVYLAKGDILTLPESIKGGYIFSGWYNAPDGASSNGKQYHNGEYALSTSVTMYADWAPQPYEVTMNWNNGSQDMTATQTVYYNEQFTLPVPEIAPNGTAFSGWFEGSLQFTDSNGKSLYPYIRMGTANLTASFKEVLSFTLEPNGETYAVSKGAYIADVTEVTIPKMYKGKPVTSINGSAFASCTKLEVINIPDTMDYIFVGIDGINATGSAFQGCSKLLAINVYETTQEEGEVAVAKGSFWSENGILYNNNDVTGSVELYAIPQAITGDIVIADGVQTISQSVFASKTKIISVTIPASVTSIETRAFTSNTNLTAIIFEEPAEGVEAQPLELADETFYSCSNLIEVILPSRIQNFTGSIFRSCSKLATINFSGAGGNYFAEDGVVMSTDEQNITTLVYYPVGREGAYTIPAGVTKIGPYSFSSRYKPTSTTSSVSYTYIGNTKITSITIPGYVTEIGEGAFRACTGIEDVVFLADETISTPLSIGDMAFYGITDAEFTDVTLPENLVYLGDAAFGGCSKLVTVNLRSRDCTQFVDGAFGTSYDSSTSVTTYYVTTLNIGPEVNNISISGVFGNKLVNVNVDPNNTNYTVLDNVIFNKAMTDLLFYPAEKEGAYVIPDTVTTIGANVFNNRLGLTELVIGKNVTYIGENAFYNCTALTSLVFEEGGTEDLVIANAAFRNCSKLTEVTLPERTTKVGSELFYGSTGLVTINLPATLTEIKLGYDSYNKVDYFTMLSGSSSNKITAVNVAEGNPNYASIDGVIYSKNADGYPEVLLFCPTAKTGTIDVPKTVAEIAPRSFYYSKATKITFSEGTTSDSLVFGAQVFYYSEVQEVELPVGLKTISARTFYNCDTLVSITIPNTVTSIGEYAFYYCIALESVTIPNSVETIGSHAFYYCKSLKNVVFEEGNDEKDEAGEYLHPLVFKNPSSSSTSGTFAYAPVTEFVFPARTTQISDYFIGISSSYGSTAQNTSLTRVEIPSTIEYIGNYAFAYCKALTSVNFFGDGVSKLQDTSTATSGYALRNTFYQCSALTSIQLPESSSADGYSLYYALSYTAIENLEFPASIKNMYSAVSYNTKLKTVTFKEGSKLQTLSNFAFSGCKALESVTLPEGLKEIGYSSLYNLPALKSIVIPSTVQKIGYLAFSGDSTLESVTFATDPETGLASIAEIQYKAFANTSLTSFTFPNSSAESIALGTGTTSELNKGRLFMGCSKLTEVTLSRSVTNIEYVFKDCYNLETINVAEDSESFMKVDGEPYLYNKAGTEIAYVFGTLPSGPYAIKEGIYSIGAFAFEDQNNITELYIPYTVEKLGSYAFADCVNLTKVVFENTAEHPSALNAANIGSYMFSGCTSLTEVQLPESQYMTEIPDYMFDGTAIKSIKIPAVVETIGNYAFRDCADLTSVEFPAETKLTSIGNYAFQGTALTSVALPATLESTGTYAFSNCQNLTEVIFLKDSEGKTAITKLGNYTFGSATLGSASEALTSITIPASVTELGTGVFRNCIGLTEVIFEEGSALTKIGSYLFDGATALTEITIPAGVSDLQTYAFRGTTSLKSINFAEGSKITDLGSYTFVKSGLTSIVLPSEVTLVDTYCFMQCRDLVSIKLNDKLTELDNYSLTNCSSLTSIAIPDSVTRIGSYAFSGCTSLSEVTFGENSKLKTLGIHMFGIYGGSGTTYDAGPACTSLTEIKIPDTVTALANYMFEGCTNLKKVEFSENSALTFMGTYTFQNSGLESITVPAGVKMLGTSATACTATSTVRLFDGCTNLTKVEFLGNITKIGGYVFYGCSSLVIDIPSTVTVIGQFAFAGTASTSFTIPKGLQAGTSYLGNGAFSHNQNLTEFKIAEGNTKMAVDPTTGALVTVASTPEILCYPAGLSGVDGVITAPTNVGIRAYAMAGCNKITKLIIPEGITQIPSYAFAQMEGLTSVELPSTLAKFGNSYSSGYVFDGCTNLTSVNFNGAAIEYISGYSFRNCVSLESIDIPESVTKIGNAAFNGSGLKEIEIPNTITLYSSSVAYSPFANSALQKVTIDTKSIPNYTFSNCEQLVDVTIGPNVEGLGNYVFQYATALESIVLPDTLVKYNETSGEYEVTIGTYTFRGCTALKNVTLPANLPSLSNYMFAGCTSLKSINVPDSVQYLGTFTFAESGIETFKFPAAATNMAGTATSSVTYSTSSNLFKDCASLKEVIFHDKFEAIGSNAFLNCTALESITLPESLKIIGAYAFKGCTNLKTINIPASVDEIGYETFMNCTSIKSIVFKNSPTVYMGRDVFNGWTEEQTVYFMFGEDETQAWMNNGSVSWRDDCNANIVWNYEG